jgi:hypothetical protein
VSLLPAVNKVMTKSSSETPETSPHGERHVAHREHDVGDDDGPEPAPGIEIQKEREQRRPQHHFRGGQRQNQEQAHRPTSPKAVAGERQRDHRTEDDRDEGGDRRHPEAQHHRIHQRGVTERLGPGVQRERLPDEVELARRLVEAVQHDDQDRQEEIPQHQQGVSVENPGPQLAGAHQLRSSVPSTLV